MNRARNRVQQSYCGKNLPWNFSQVRNFSVENNFIGIFYKRFLFLISDLDSDTLLFSSKWILKSSH